MSPSLFDGVKPFEAYFLGDLGKLLLDWNQRRFTASVCECESVIMCYLYILCKKPSLSGEKDNEKCV